MRNADFASFVRPLPMLTSKNEASISDFPTITYIYQHKIDDTDPTDALGELIPLPLCHDHRTVHRLSLTMTALEANYGKF